MGQSPANIARTHAMVSTQSFIAPLIELARDESVQSKVLDVARQFFSNSNITINLIPALIAAACSSSSSPSCSSSSHLQKMQVPDMEHQLRNMEHPPHLTEPRLHHMATERTKVMRRGVTDPS